MHIISLLSDATASCPADACVCPVTAGRGSQAASVCSSVLEDRCRNPPIAAEDTCTVLPVTEAHCSGCDGHQTTQHPSIRRSILRQDEPKTLKLGASQSDERLYTGPFRTTEERRAET